jgi:transposase
MHEITLTTEVKAALECRHRKSRDVHESDRIKVILLRSEGWLVSDIAQALRVHESTITRHLKDYSQEKKLISSKGGSSSFLSEAQTEQLIKDLSKNLYHHTHEIVTYITERWKIEYSVPGLNKWLHKHGFSYKKPKGRPCKADPERQAEFIETYNDLKSSLPAEETVLFIDSVHPTQATKLSYGWIRTGKTLEVSTTASRTRMNIIGAIELNKIEDTITANYETINGKSIENFLEKLRVKYPAENKLHIILDQAGYHRSEELKKKAELLNIKFHYLPPYSPNLNPIERLWKVMNEHVRNNYCFASAKEFREKINCFFEKTLPKIGGKLSDRINDNFQELSPAH